MDTISPVLSTFILNALWQVPFIAATAWLCVRITKRLPAKYHHAIWVASLLFAIAIPLMSLPRPSVLSQRYMVDSPIGTAHDEYNSFALDNSHGPLLRVLRHRSQKVSLAPGLMRALVLLYTAFLVWRVFRLAWLGRRTLQLAAGVTKIDLSPQVRNLADQLAGRYSLPNVAIRGSKQIACPFIYGLRRPVLAIPEAILGETSDEDLSSILAHEFAHLKRLDFPLNLIYEMLFVPIAFHPAAILLKHRIDDSREIACDEMAAGETRSRSGYARSLLRIAQSISDQSLQRHSDHALGLFETDNLEERIMNLVASKNPIGKRWGQFALATVATIFAVVCFAMSGYTLQVSAAANPAFYGTWRADYEGNDFLVLRLDQVKGKPSGAIRMMSTQINLEGDGEVYHVSGKLSEPMQLTHLRSDANGLFFDFLEEGDTDPVHWRMELTSPGSAKLNWVELPNGLKFKPIHLTRDPIGTPAEAESAAAPSTAFVLGDLKIEGDVHDRDQVRERVLKAWESRVFETSKALAESVAEAGVRNDFQERGYFKVVVHDPIVKTLGPTDGKERILLITPVTEGEQYRLKSLVIQNTPADRPLAIPAATLREQFHIHDGDLLNVAQIRAGLERVVKLYRDAGYSEAVPQPNTSIVGSTLQIGLTIEINEGTRKPH